MYIETELLIRGITTLAKPRTLKTISCLLLCGCFFCCGGTFPRLGSLMSFEMEDQFRNSHSHADFKGRVLVVIGSDREGASAAENWGKALSHSLKPERDSGRLNLIGLSNLKGVPFFLKDYVRGKFSQNAGDWALMDWKGLFADSYGFIAGNANVVVFDKEGALALSGPLQRMPSRPGAVFADYLLISQGFPLDGILHTPAQFWVIFTISRRESFPSSCGRAQYHDGIRRPATWRALG